MAQKPMSNSDGCLWIFITIVFTVIGFGLIKIITGASDVLAIIIALVISLFFSFRILGKPSGKMIFRQAIFLFVFFYGIKLIGGFFISVLRNFEVESPSFSEEEIVTNAIIVEANDTIPVYTSNRFWKDSFGNNYNGLLTVREKDYLALKNHINTYRPPSNQNFWGNLYKYIDVKDSPRLDLVMANFSRINSEKKLNQMEFADMVVTCIQDIPYSFVFQEACMPAENYEDSIREILEVCPECCIGDIMFGIQNPVSFIQNLKGDCDTRTVLIYSILKHFNYDVAILNSDFYKHSILGLNLPASGLNKIYNGKKYMLWETTAKYYSIGAMPGNFNNLTHWNVVLTSK
jgi:hypothetical protein